MSELPANPIFISYSRRDTEIMQKIVIFLRDQGFKVWVDNERLIPGTSIWEEEIEKAIKAASVVIVVMSPDSKNSEWVRREISMADQYRKQILPILVGGDEDSSVTLRLITRQFIDLRQNETAGLQSLHSALERYLETSQSPLISQSINAPTYHPLIEHVIQPQVKTIESVSTPWDSILWATVGWTFAGAAAGYFYDGYGELVGGSIGGLIGGLVVLLALQGYTVFSNPKKLLLPLFMWAIAGAIGWEIGWDILSEATGAGFGMATFILIGLVSTLGLKSLSTTWKPILIITFVWLITSAAGWLISRRLLIDILDMNYSTGWVLGTAFAWAVGGFVLSRQMLKQ